MFEVTQILAERVGDRLPISCIAPTPFWSTYGLLGFQGMMVMMREKPELFAYLMERRGRQRMEMLKGLAAAGVQYLWLEECLSSADLISPRDYERFAFATAGPYIAEAKRLGLTVILYYCGDVIPRLPWLKRLGMDALAVEESKKGFSVDIADVIAAVGDTCCVFGNVDAVQVMCEGIEGDDPGRGGPPAPPGAACPGLRPLPGQPVHARHPARQGRLVRPVRAASRRRRMRNPDKRRFLDAARHIETAEIPLFEIGPDMALARQILGKDLPMDRLVYELPIPDYVELNRRMGNDMVYFAHIWRLGRVQRQDAEGRLHYIDGMMKSPEDLEDIWYPDLDLHAAPAGGAAERGGRDGDGRGVQHPAGALHRGHGDGLPGFLGERQAAP